MNPNTYDWILCLGHNIHLSPDWRMMTFNQIAPSQNQIDLDAVSKTQLPRDVNTKLK